LIHTTLCFYFISSLLEVQCGDAPLLLVPQVTVLPLISMLRPRSARSAC